MPSWTMETSGTMVPSGTGIDEMAMDDETDDTSVTSMTNPTIVDDGSGGDGSGGDEGAIDDGSANETAVTSTTNPTIADDGSSGDGYGGGDNIFDGQEPNEGVDTDAAEGGKGKKKKKGGKGGGKKKPGNKGAGGKKKPGKKGGGGGKKNNGGGADKGGGGNTTVNDTDPLGGGGESGTSSPTEPDTSVPSLAPSEPTPEIPSFVPSEIPTVAVTLAPTPSPTTQAPSTSFPTKAPSEFFTGILDVNVTLPVSNSHGITAQQVLDGAKPPDSASDTFSYKDLLAASAALVLEVKYPATSRRGLWTIDGGDDDRRRGDESGSGRREEEAKEERHQWSRFLLDVKQAERPSIVDGIDVDCPPWHPTKTMDGSDIKCQNFTCAMPVQVVELKASNVRDDVNAKYEEAIEDGIFAEQLKDVTPDFRAVWRDPAYFGGGGGGGAPSAQTRSSDGGGGDVTKIVISIGAVAGVIGFLCCCLGLFVYWKRTRGGWKTEAVEWDAFKNTGYDSL